MHAWILYSASAIAILVIVFRGIFYHRKIVGKILAANLAGSGVFLLLVAIARRAPRGEPDPVIHAMVLTSIVVSVSATALALALLRRLRELSRRSARAPEASGGEDSRRA